MRLTTPHCLEHKTDHSRFRPLFVKQFKCQPTVRDVEFLTHAEEADFCTEMFRIARHFEKGFRTGTKQEIVEGLLVLQDQRGQMTGQGEDHLHVRGRKKFPATLFQPTIASARLTLRAVPIST